jgi:hypothetical protein
MTSPPFSPFLSASRLEAPPSLSSLPSHVLSSLSIGNLPLPSLSGYLQLSMTPQNCVPYKRQVFCLLGWPPPSPHLSLCTLSPYSAPSACLYHCCSVLPLSSSRAPSITSSSNFCFRYRTLPSRFSSWRCAASFPGPSHLSARLTSSAT